MARVVKTPPPPPEPPQIDGSVEFRRVRRWRIECALRAGLTYPEAELFADGDQTTSLLRRLESQGATPAQIAAIIT